MELKQRVEAFFDKLEKKLQKVFFLIWKLFFKSYSATEIAESENVFSVKYRYLRVQFKTKCFFKLNDLMISYNIIGNDISNSASLQNG